MLRFIRNYILITLVISGTGVLGWSIFGDVRPIAPYVGMDMNRALLRAYVSAITVEPLDGVEEIENPDVVYGTASEPPVSIISAYAIEIFSPKSPDLLKIARFGSYFYDASKGRGCIELHSNEAEFRRDAKRSIAYRTCSNLNIGEDFYQMTYNAMLGYVRYALRFKAAVAAQVADIMKQDVSGFFRSPHDLTQQLKAQHGLAPLEYILSFPPLLPETTLPVDGHPEVLRAVESLQSAQANGIRATRRLAGGIGLAAMVAGYCLIGAVLLALGGTAHADGKWQKVALRAFFLSQSPATVAEELDRRRQEKAAAERELVEMWEIVHKLDVDLQTPISALLRMDDRARAKVALQNARFTQINRDTDRADKQAVADARQALAAKLAELHDPALAAEVQKAYDSGQRAEAEQRLKLALEHKRRERELNALEERIATHPKAVEQRVARERLKEAREILAIARDHKWRQKIYEIEQALAGLRQSGNGGR